jgi:hypothetical protein
MLGRILDQNNRRLRQLEKAKQRANAHPQRWKHQRKRSRLRCAFASRTARRRHVKQGDEIVVEARQEQTLADKQQPWMTEANLAPAKNGLS